ncbi:MAG TPA: hypothetical protein VHM88_08275, partial [Candidatus Acidoferrales bacterium]|nr:hypothetical protein [Candidatus Acidoferrales bacterium]
VDTAMAYDVVRGQVVLYGLLSQAGVTQTWTWTGTSWKAMNPLHSPPGRLYPSMAYDPTTRKVLMFGGSSASILLKYLGDTWAWDGSDWTQLSPVHSPSPRQMAAIASFATQSRVLLIGGTDNADLSDAWAWDGNDWTAMPSPGPRHGAASADVGSKVLLFGGTAHAVANTDSWDGQAWSST